MKKLAEVAMTDAGFSHVKFKFPDTVYILFISGNIIDDLDISNLLHLQVLFAVNCGLNDVPKVHELAPVQALALTIHEHEIIAKPIRGQPNPLKNLNAEVLSEFCHLSTLILNLTLTGPVTLDNFCRCSRLKRWVSLLKDDKSLVNDFTAFHCGNGNRVFANLYQALVQV